MIETIKNYILANTGNEIGDEVYHMDFFEAGLDSLLLVGLIVELETLNNTQLNELRLTELLSGSDTTFGELINAFKK
ncbi:acyl carrier protein [Dickeya undicola]|uniref:acyl carrier protein n=1 Tax=Dickeya undicola TaxID=1577887 RepID=UPI003F287B6C